MSWSDLTADRPRKVRWIDDLSDPGWTTLANAFCPTGEGGGSDNSCSPGDKGGSAQGKANNQKLAETMLKNTGSETGDPFDVSDKSRGEHKARLAADLTNRLTENEGFSKSEAKAYVTSAVNSWANTSGDHDPEALGIQIAASQEFMADRDYPQHFKDTLDENEDKGVMDTADAMMEINQAILRQMYEATQEDFRKMGLGPDDKITLYRGMAFNDDKAIEGMSKHTAEARFTEREDLFESVSVELQPISSFSFHRPMAAGFSGGEKYGMMLRADVRVGDILSTPRTGFGCLSEGEVVVMARGVSKAGAYAYEGSPT